jgi:hypothetical protein
MGIVEGIEVQNNEVKKVQKIFTPKSFLTHFPADSLFSRCVFGIGSRSSSVNVI